jgi:hypothetical protein
MGSTVSLTSFAELKEKFILSGWEKFYRDLFGFKIDLSGLPLPGRKNSFDLLIIVAQGITPQRLYNKCTELFFCWKWTNDDLDKIVQSERTARDGTYAVWFRRRIEADEDLRDFSAVDLQKRRIPGITLEERFLMELKYFKETGNHLDIRGITLCSGSHYVGGRIPGVHWDLSDGLGVGWLLASCSSPGLGFRRPIIL